MTQQNIDTSGTGETLTLVASLMYPQGVTLTAFAPEAAPYSFGAVQIADLQLDMNGNVYTFGTPTPGDMTVNVVPSTAEYELLMDLAQANMAGSGRAGKDVISITVNPPQGSGLGAVTHRQGAITSYPGGRGRAQGGKSETAAFIFKFGKPGF